MKWFKLLRFTKILAVDYDVYGICRSFTETCKTYEIQYCIKKSYLLRNISQKFIFNYGIPLKINFCKQCGVHKICQLYIGLYKRIHHYCERVCINKSCFFNLISIMHFNYVFQQCIRIFSLLTIDKMDFFATICRKETLL